MECRGLSVWNLVLLCFSFTSAHYLRDSKNETVSSQGTCLYNGTWFQDKEELPTRGLCLICHCFPGFVEPNAFTCSVIDCPWEDYHKRFPGCTPIYADRDCCPIGWECDYGTQNAGQQLSKGAGCDCEWRYLKHYEAKGCRPVYEEKPKNDDKCTCPWRFDCSQADEIHADERVCLYKKHVYPVGSRIPTSNPCETCSCATDYFTQAATISCTTTECPAVYSQTPLPEGCHYVYKEGQCCPTSVECPTGQKDNIYQVPSCEYKGKMYYDGEQIYPDEDPCLICLCNSNWTGIKGGSCRQHDCMLERDARKLKQGCIPIYHEKTCCPIDYHCADDDFDFKSNRGASFKSDDDEDEMCFFESRYYQIGHVLDIKHPTNCVACTCKTPPDFTCIHSACPPPPGEDYTHCKAVYKPHSCCPNYTCEEKTSTACPDPICKGTNCWLVKQENGCQTCRCKSRCMPCPPMCQPENPNNECSGCICQINSTSLFDSEILKKEEEIKEEEEKDALQQLIQECKKMECSTDERCMLVEQKCDNESTTCLPIPKCEKVAFGCGQPSCPEGAQEIGSYENSCPLCYCKDSAQEPQYKLTCRVQSCEENCVLAGRDEEGCPICKCPQGNLEERACASSPCNGYNCTMAVNSLGCAECRCQLSCKPKECPVGCDMDLDVPQDSGLECGCQCKNSTAAMEYIHSKAVPETCSPVSCRGLNCSVFEDKSGCPTCQCKTPCPVPECQEGCQIEKEVSQPGRCPGCACKLSRSARDNSGKECPPPTCLGYNCSVITVETGCQKCLCESPCEEAPQCPSHCKLETNVPEGRCRGCVCSYGEHADSDNRPHRGGGKVPDTPDSEIASEKREDMEADFIPLPGKDLVPGVDKFFLMHGNLDKDQLTGMPGFHYSGGHAFPVFGEPLESGLYNLDDLIPGELESGFSDEAREEVDEEHDYSHDDGYGEEFAEEKAVNEEDEEKCAQKNCPEGQKCVIRRLQCIRTPCPTIPVCIDIEPRCPIPMCAIGCMVMKWDDEVCPSCFCGIIRGAEGKVCPRTRCAGRRCYNVIGDDGCPQCKCDSICIPPKCHDGCHVEKNPPGGKCATCVCEDRAKPIATGTTPSQNTSGSNIELGNESENPEASKDASEGIDHSTTTASEEENDIQGRHPVAVGDQISSESKPEIIHRNKLPDEDFSAEFYNALAEIENEVMTRDQTTVTVNLPTTIDAADIFASTTEGSSKEPPEPPRGTYSGMNIFTHSSESEVSTEYSPVETTEQSTNSLPEDYLTTKKPCTQKHHDTDEKQINSLNIFKIAEETNKLKLETIRPYTFTTEVLPTVIPTRKVEIRPSSTTSRPVSHSPNKNTGITLKPIQPSASHGASEIVDNAEMSVFNTHISPNRNKPISKPQIHDSYNDEIDRGNEGMKPILQNLQQLMSNIHHVLSSHPRPDVFQNYESSFNNPHKQQNGELSTVDKVTEQPIESIDDLNQSETVNKGEIISENITSNESNTHVDINSSSISHDLADHSVSQDDHNIHKLSSDSENTVENSTLEVQSNLSSQVEVTPQTAAAYQQQYFLNPNVVPPVLQQGVNPQYHMFPQFPYQNLQSNLQALGLMPPQAPYQNPLQTVYSGSGQNQLFNAQQQNTYYPSIQPHFISPFQTEQFGQSPSQIHKQHVLLTNIPIPPSLQQQLNAGTQTLGFLQQLINHRNNPFYQQQLLQSQMQLQQQIGSPPSDSKPIEKETSDTESPLNNTIIFNQHASSSDKQQTQNAHQQYVYSNNQPLSSQQQFENGEVGSQQQYADNYKPQQQHVGGIQQQSFINNQQHQVSTQSSASLPEQNLGTSTMPPFPITSSNQMATVVEQFNHHAPQQVSSTQSINQSPSISNFNSQQQQLNLNTQDIAELVQQYQQLQEQIIKAQSSQQQYVLAQNDTSKLVEEHILDHFETKPNNQVQDSNANNIENSQNNHIESNNGSIIVNEESHQQYQTTDSKPAIVQQNSQNSFISNQYVPQVQDNLPQYKPLTNQHQQENFNNEQSIQNIVHQSNSEFNVNPTANVYQQTVIKPQNQDTNNQQYISGENHVLSSNNRPQIQLDHMKPENVPSVEQNQNMHSQIIYNQNILNQQQAQQHYVPESSSHQTQTVGISPQSQDLASYQYQQQSNNQFMVQNQEPQNIFISSVASTTPNSNIQQDTSSHYQPIQQQYAVQPMQQNVHNTFHLQPIQQAQQQQYIGASNQSPQHTLNAVSNTIQQQDIKNQTMDTNESINLEQSAVLSHMLQQQYSNPNQKPLAQTFENPQLQQTYAQQPQQTYVQTPQQTYVQQQLQQPPSPQYQPQHQQYIQQQQPTTQQQQFQQTYIHQHITQQPNVQQAYIQQQPNTQQQNLPHHLNTQQQNIPQQIHLQQNIPQNLNLQQQQSFAQQQYVPQHQYISQSQNIPQLQNTQQQNVQQIFPQHNTQQNHQQQNSQQQQYIPQQNNFPLQQNIQLNPDINQQHLNSNERPSPEIPIHHQFISSQSTFAYQSPQTQQQLVQQHYLNSNQKPLMQTQEFQIQKLTTNQPTISQSNQQKYIISSNQPLQQQEKVSINSDNHETANEHLQQQFHQHYLVPEDNSAPQEHIEDQVLIEPQFSGQTNEEQTYIEPSSSETQQTHSDDEPLNQQHHEVHQHHNEDKYLALMPIAQITTADNQTNHPTQSQDNLSILGPDEAQPIQQLLQDLKPNENNAQTTQIFIQQTEPPFQQSHLPNLHHGVKSRPGAIYRPHFTSPPSTTNPPTSIHDLFPAPSRPINNKPEVQQQDWVDQEFVEDDLNQEFDYDDFDLPESTTYDPFSGRQSVTPQTETTVKPSPAHFSNYPEQQYQHELLENFDNHQPDSVRKPIDQQELVDEFNSVTTPKKHFFSRTPTTPSPNIQVTANSSNLFASFPTASPTAEAYSSPSRHSTKPPSPLPSYQCPTPHCNGYNCSLIRGSDGCQKCVCDSPCAPCPQNCVKTKTLSEGRCPICDCTVAPSLSLAAPTSQCPVVNCRGSNCRKVKDSNGCQTCICDPKCVEPKCDPGCEILRDVPPGQCPGCVCRVTVVQAVVPQKRQCSPVSCGRNCKETTGPDGCPLCMCNPECPPPKCDVGCQVQTDVAAGECPTCVCPNFADDDDDEDDDLYCPNLFCSEYGCREIPGPAGCPICMCDPVCKTPVCDPGCQIVSNKYHGRCPVCVCRNPINGTYASSANKPEETVKTVPQQVQQQEQSPVTFSGLVEAVEAEEDSTLSTLHTTVTVELDTGGFSETTTEVTTNAPITTCPAPTCSGLRCNMEMDDNGCEICKCKYKCPKPKCVGHCYAETNAPSHRCPGCVCPQRAKPPKN